VPGAPAGYSDLTAGKMVISVIRQGGYLMPARQLADGSGHAHLLLNLCCLPSVSW